MHSGILSAWIPGQFVGGDKIAWLGGLIVVGWLVIRWWSAKIAKQFERDSSTVNEGVKRQQGGVNWDLGGLLKLLLLLFVLACAILATLL
jgi:hypothetical protein